MVTHALGHMMYSSQGSHVPKGKRYHGAIGGLVIIGRAHCMSF